MSMNKIKQYIEDREDKEFGVPAIANGITESDECCNCGEDLSLEMYEAFSNGYETAVEDLKEHNSQTIKGLIEVIVYELNTQNHTLQNECSLRDDCVHGQCEHYMKSEAITDIATKLKTLIK